MSLYSLHPTRIGIGVSACLLGQQVRYDGGHKHDRYITDELGQAFDLVSICPETGIGMGTPRPPVQLVERDAGIEARGVFDISLNVTDKLVNFGRQTVTQLPAISGYLFKSKSPSCGAGRVKLLKANGRWNKQGTGLYAREVQNAYPLLPVEDENRLSDTALRDNWLERVFAYHRWQLLRNRRPSVSALLEFHTVHKLVIMAHGSQQYRILEHLMAKVDGQSIHALYEEYARQFMHALRYQATVKRHTAVLKHILARLKKVLAPRDRQALHSAINAYQLGQLPRSIAVHLLQRHARSHADDFLRRQLYLNMDTREMKLRSNCPVT